MTLASSRLVRGSIRIPVLIAEATDTSTRSYTADGTWDDVSGASVTWTPNQAGIHQVVVFANWIGTSSNWLHHQWRVMLDGALTNVTPDNVHVAQIDNQRNYPITSTVDFEVDVPDPASKTVKLQTRTGSSLDRTFEVTYMQVWGPV